MNTSLCPKLPRYVAFISLVFALSSCGVFFKHAPVVKHAKSSPDHYAASDYVKHLELARLNPENRENDLDVINAYAKQKAKKSPAQTLLILEYKTSGDTALQRVAAPILNAQKTTEFSDLFDIMNQLAANQSTLHNMHVVTAKIEPDKALKLPDTTEQDVIAALNSQEQRLLENTQALPALDDIYVQLNLIRFFIDNRFRDAAYLAVDNAKQTLASLPHGPHQDADSIKRLSQNIESLESEMRKTMPFSL